MKTYAVPTGKIIIIDGQRGKLELVSIGDYGKEVNIKCNAMGLSRIPKQVQHTKLLPFSKKWVVTISTQYGCSMDCKFCDVPKVGSGRNATMIDLWHQVVVGLTAHPEIVHGDRLNIHYARMGEPTYNDAVLKFTRLVRKAFPIFNVVHPVLSTMMPKRNGNLQSYLYQWIRIKNGIYDGDAGLQLSINSTDEAERDYMFSGNALTLSEIGQMMLIYRPVGRKFTLNFPVANYEIDPVKLLEWFDPKYWLIKLTPMHKTKTAEEHHISTVGDYTEYYPYEQYEKALIEAGYDVLVFIASKEEDESKITCGNAILANTMEGSPNE